MNQSNKKQNSFLKTILLAVICGLGIFSATFVLLSYLLFQAPNYEDFLGFFPYILLLAGSLLIAFFSQILARNFLPLSLIMSGTISIVSIILGIVFFSISENILTLVASHVVFVLTTVLFQFFMIKKSPRKKRSKNFPFKK